MVFSYFPALKKKIKEGVSLEPTVWLLCIHPFALISASLPGTLEDCHAHNGKDSGSTSLV